ncbi:hypothetical protein EB796_017160 [Bugula neritina]|uniref:Uncharacterized protein n=1 Tax=Bugula neritina TaxID=10212 RepID=A0A7J7JE83_BUGNE|nr:hypothetical protein EB796_017160 [Bugula neritina]
MSVGEYHYQYEYNNLYKHYACCHNRHFKIANVIQMAEETDDLPRPLSAKDMQSQNASTTYSCPKGLGVGGEIAEEECLDLSTMSSLEDDMDWLFSTPSKRSPNLARSSVEQLSRKMLASFESPELLPRRRALTHKLHDFCGDTSVNEKSVDALRDSATLDLHSTGLAAESEEAELVNSPASSNSLSVLNPTSTSSYCTRTFTRPKKGKFSNHNQSSAVALSDANGTAAAAATHSKTNNDEPLQFTNDEITSSESLSCHSNDSNYSDSLRGSVGTAGEYTRVKGDNARPQLK